MRKILFILLFTFLFLMGCSAKDSVTDQTTEVEKNLQWPDNEFTQTVSKPDFGVLKGAVEIDEEFFVSVTDSDFEDVKDYVEILKSEGYNIDQKVFEEEALGIEVYNYTASNENGYTVYIEYSVRVCSITIYK